MGVIKNRNNQAFSQKFSLFMIRVSSSMAYAVFFSGLSLYLTQNLHYTSIDATAIAGLFLSLNYFLPLVGGIFTTRVIEYKRFFCLGTFFGFLGCLFLALGFNVFLGLSLFLIDSLVCNVCLNMFITSMYEKDQIVERRVGFVWNFIGMNLGFLGGYFLTGFSTLLNSYTNLFYLMSVLMFISLALAFFFTKEPDCLSGKRQVKHPILMTILFMIMSVGVIQFALRHGVELKIYVTFAAVMAQVMILYHVYRSTVLEARENIIKFIGYSVMSVLFWTAYMTTPIAIMQFIQYDVNRLVMGVELAPQWIVNVDSIIIILLGPIFAMFLARNQNQSNSAISYFQFGFLAAAFGFFALYVGIFLSAGASSVSVLPVLIYIIFLVLGEISINPVGASLIGDLIPEAMRGLMTGAWTMNIGIGSLISSFVSGHLILPYVNINGLSESFAMDLEHTMLAFVFCLLSLVGILEFIKQKQRSVLMNNLT